MKLNAPNLKMDIKILLYLIPVLPAAHVIQSIKKILCAHAEQLFWWENSTAQVLSTKLIFRQRKHSD